MSLCAILDHKQLMLTCQRHDRVHITEPASQVDTDDCLSTGCEYCSDGFGRDVLTICIHIRKHRYCTCIHNRRRRGKKCPRSNNHLIARSNTQSFQRYIQCYGAVCQRNGILRASPGREFFLELTALLASPLINFVRENYITNSVGIFFGEGRPGKKWSIEHR